jgi:Tfp pilus assembly protein PilF
MVRNCWIITILAAMGAGVARADVPLTYVNSRTFVLEVEHTAADEIDLYESLDGGGTWSPAAYDQGGPNEIVARTQSDGRYEYFFVLRNAAGASSPPPTYGTKSHATVIVDTLSPLVQIRAAEAAGRPGAAEVRLRVAVVDEELGDDGVRMFYREAGDDADRPWTDGGIVRVTNGAAVWAAPAGGEAEIELRLVATDRAGNQAVSEPVRVALPVAKKAPASRPTSAPAASQPSMIASRPVEKAPPPEVQSARQLGERFLQEGRYALAIARLDDALAIRPTDPDLLRASGQAHYWAGKYDKAEARFRSGLAADARHSGALEGLALLLVTQQRYVEARPVLERWAEATGSSAARIHLGDLEHRLGNRGAALAAWKAAEADAKDEATRAKSRMRLAQFGGPLAAGSGAR